MESSTRFAVSVDRTAGATRPARHDGRIRLLLCLYLCVGLWGVPTPGCARPLDSMDHRRWIAADGGPSQVGAIAQTRDGYLWLGTNDSLYRFDGLRFVRYEEPGFDVLGIVSALLAVDDGLWVGLRAGGATFLSTTPMRLFQPGATLPGGAIYSLARDQDNAIWAAADDGLGRFDGKSWQHIADDWKFPGHNARAVFVDRDGVVWAANEHRLYYLPKGSHAFVDTGMPVDWVSQIAQAPDGAIWLSERYAGQLHRVAWIDGTLTRRSMTIAKASNGLLFDRDGGLWVSTLGDGVLHMSDPLAANMLAGQERYTTKDGLSSDYLWPLLADNEGNVWAGTSAGLDRFRPRLMTPADFPAGALNFALAAGKDGSLWAGSRNRPTMRQVHDKIEILDMPAPVTAAMSDSEGNIWMGGPGGIWRSSGGRLQRVASLPTTASIESSVRAMARDAAGDLWVSINRLGLFVLRDGRWTPIARPSDRATQVMPVTAYADPLGRLWFGYRDNLLITRDGSGEKRWGAAQGMHIGHVTAIFHDGRRTWIGGQYGAGFIEGDRFHTLQLPVNGLFDNLYAIIPVPAKSGVGEDLWIHGKSGIFQLPAAELAAAIADPTRPIRFRSFDLMGGLANDPYQVLPLPTAVRGADGRIWFSTSSGVVWIDPDLPSPDDAPPKVMIESLTADGARVDGAASPELAADTKRVVIDYTALSLSAPESLHFRYRLDGYDTGWQDAGRQRQAVYTGLDAGRYRFRVIADSQDGVPSAQEAQVAFSIPPVFYRRPLFLVLASLLAGAIFWLVYRMELRRSAEQLRARLEERHGERERIARELHDTLLQGVQGLMLRFQAVADMIPENQPARRSLEQALDRADQVLEEGRDRVRDLRRRGGRNDDLADALAAVGAECRRTVGQATFGLTVKGSTSPLQLLVRDEAYRIGHEAIVNAYAHANAKRVQVEIVHSPRMLRLSVVDDGCGIDPSYLTPIGRPDHWGLRGMHERAHKIGATLEVISAPGRGTEIRLVVKASLAYRPRPRRMLRAIFARNKEGNEL